MIEEGHFSATVLGRRGKDERLKVVFSSAGTPFSPHKKREKLSDCRAFPGKKSRE